MTERRREGDLSCSKIRNDGESYFSPFHDPTCSPAFHFPLLWTRSADTTGDSAARLMKGGSLFNPSHPHPTPPPPSTLSTSFSPMREKYRTCYVSKKIDFWVLPRGSRSSSYRRNLTIFSQQFLDRPTNTGLYLNKGCCNQFFVGFFLTHQTSFPCRLPHNWS